MNDIGLFINEEGNFDLKISNGDFASDDGLETAVSLSLFTDRRATDDELPFGEISKRGWWGDQFLDVPGDKIGSKLWFLSRSKRTQETLRRTEDYCREALQWLIEDGVAKTITVTAIFEGVVSEGRWYADIKIEKPDGKTFKFKAAWDQQKLIRG